MTTRDVVLVAMFAAIMVVLGLSPRIPLTFLPVPITLQTLGVMLAGTMIGPIRGALAMLLFLLLIAMGLPVLAGGQGGLGSFAGPTAGFIYGWPIGAFVAGWAFKAWGQRVPKPWGEIAVIFLACVLGGIVIVYLCGVAWLVLMTGIGLQKALIGMVAFVPGDLIKAVLSSLIVHNVRRAYPLDLK